MTALSQDDVQETRDLLLGHRIVSAEVGSFEVPNRQSWCNTASGRMVLDDGTTVYVVPNEGGCSCGGGEYGAFSYRIYVVADAVEINAVQIDGDDGSGYYGTGYVLHVIPGGETR